MLDDPRSHGLWEKTAPPAPETHVLSRETTVDVAVIGAGYTGLSAALHLAEAGANVAVIEAAEIGFGGSGRNVGLVNAGLWVRPDDMPDILGHPHGERLLSLLAGAPDAVFALIEQHQIACEAERQGTLHCGVGRAGAEELAERTRQWQARGAPVEFLSHSEAERLTGSPAFSAGLLDRRAGTIQPLAYARGLAAAAIAAGAEILTNSRVTNVLRQGEAWRVATLAGSINADWIIVATTTTPWPELREEIVHLPYFNIATKPLSANLLGSILPERQGCWDTKSVLSSFRLDQAGRLIVGSVGELRGTAAGIHRRWAKRHLQRLFPQLGDIVFETEWYGQIGMTSDAVPRFHTLDERVVSISGYNGRGIAPGTVFGRVLAEFVLGKIGEAEMPLPASVPKAQGFRGFHESVYRIGSQLAHLKPGY